MKTASITKPLVFTVALIAFGVLAARLALPWLFNFHQWWSLPAAIAAGLAIIIIMGRAFNWLWRDLSNSLPEGE